MAIKRKVSTWKHHKYYAKVPIDKDHNRYFYSKEEYDAFMRGDKDLNDQSSQNGLVDTFLDKFGKIGTDKSSSNLDVINLLKSSASIKISDPKVNELVKSISSKDLKTVNVGKQACDNIIKSNGNKSINGINPVGAMVVGVQIAAYQTANAVVNAVDKISKTFGIGRYNYKAVSNNGHVDFYLDGDHDVCYKDKDGSMYYTDKNGDKCYKDSRGRKYYKNSKGEQYYKDERGDTFVYDARGAKKYMKMEDPKPTDKAEEVSPEEPKNADEEKREQFDCEYTDEELLTNLKWSGYYSTLRSIYGLGSDDDVIRFLRANLENGESLSHLLERLGLFDERQDGYHPSSFDDLVKLDHDIDDDIDMREVNYDNLTYLSDNDYDGDGYPDDYEDYGYTNNCAYCTVTYEMRQRGYDVEASSVSGDTANTEDVIESWYEGGEFKHYDYGIPSANITLMQKDILQECPDGSRGQFCVYWSGGGGHSMVYEVRDGEVYIRDCQINKEYKLNDYPYAEYISECMYMRTDNLELTEESLVAVKNKNK